MAQVGPVILAPPAGAWTGQQTSAVASVAPSPMAADTLATLTKVCLPVLEGRDLRSVAGEAGFRFRDGAWVLTIHGKRQIALEPPDSANPHLCGASIDAAPGGARALARTLGAWATAQSPPLTPIEQGATRATASETWITSSWSGKTAAGVEDVVLTHEQAASTSDGLSHSELLVTLAPA